MTDEEKSKDGIDYEVGTFGYDLDFLRKHDNLIVLKNGSSQVIVSPKYQAKVFTSTARGLKGESFGWINYEEFDGEIDNQFNAYGGENRFWLGPEGGKFSLFFKPGTKMTFANWKTPPPIDTESWQVFSQNGNSVVMEKMMSLLNYNNFTLQLKAQRSIRILKKKDIEKILNLQLEQDVNLVGFTTENIITNIGDVAWTKKTGTPCIWILDMFNPSDNTVIVIPYNQNASGPVATTDYFGEIPPDRLKYDNGTLFFKADGKSRGKIGIPPPRAKQTAGSYDPDNQVLTITHFDINGEAVYMNQEWTTSKDPWEGDAVNAYNDGPLEDGSQLGPFYELESVSSAAFLKPQEKMRHTHSVFHFTGSEENLNKISLQVLGVSIGKIKGVF